jgi:hypothetical protein
MIPNYITEWLIGIGARPIDLVFIFILVSVRWHDMREIKRLRHMVTQHDKLILVQAWLLKIKLGINTVNVHRTGDYEIVNPLNND